MGNSRPFSPIATKRDKSRSPSRIASRTCLLEASTNITNTQF
ncbi:hypothetical protein MY4038_004110 [Beauveria bassiana]